MTDEAAVRAALSSIVDPAKGVDIVSAGQVKALSVDGDAVSFILEVDAARGGAMEPLRAAAEQAVSTPPGIARVSAIMTAHAAAGASTARTPS